MKKLMIILVFISTLTVLSSCGYSRNKVKKYNTYLNRMENAQTYMPSLDSLGNYSNVSVGYKWTFLFFFEVRTIVLSVGYDDSYDHYKEKMLNDYNYLADPVYDSDGDELMPEIETIYKDYLIKVVDSRLPDGGLYIYSFPKYFLMTGFNDEKKSLVYMFFEDFDLDSFPNENLNAFIKEYYRF